MSTTIASSIPPGYERLATGTIIKEGDLAWNFHSRKFEAPAQFIAMRGIGPRRVTESNYIIRKVIQEVQQEQTVSQDQAPKPNYGLW